MKKDMKIPFEAPLHKLDSETQTFGCRQKNPDICGNNSLPSAYAFATEDCICRKPSRAWERQYKNLKVQAAK